MQPFTDLPANTPATPATTATVSRGTRIQFVDPETGTGFATAQVCGVRSLCGTRTLPVGRPALCQVQYCAVENGKLCFYWQPYDSNAIRVLPRAVRLDCR